jgi:hypothetical protein
MHEIFASLVIRASNTTIHNGTNSTISAAVNSNVTFLSVNDPHIGSLPLVKFIYILSGSLIFVACLKPVVLFLRLCTNILSGFRSETRSDETAQIQPFLDWKPRPQMSLESAAKTAVNVHRLAANIQSDSGAKTSSFELPNLPLPIPIPEVEADAPTPQVTIEDIRAWQQLINQKQQLDIAIANLQQVDRVKRRSGAGNAAVAEKIRESLYRLAQLTGSINRTFERFKLLQESWASEEWTLILQIHESL